MFKVLFKKQLAELLENYTPKKARGKGKRSKGAAVLYLFLFAFLSVSLGMMFYPMADAMSKAQLEGKSLAWMYFLIVLAMTMAIGVLGSVFSAYSTLYRAKDNETLLAMPIPPLKLLAARMSAVFFSGLVFELIAFLPACVVYFVVAPFSVGALLGCLVSFVGVSMIVLALTCFLGWIVALGSAYTRNKSIVTVVITIAAVALYYVFYFRAVNFFAKLVTDAAFYGSSLSEKAPLLKLVGTACTGKASGMLLLFGTGAVLMALTVLILVRSYEGIITTNRGTKKKVYTAGKLSGSSIDGALLKKEFRRFTQSPAYMLNCGLGLLILLGLMVYAVIEFDTVHGLFQTLTGETGIDADSEWYALICALPAALTAMLVCLNPISAPSIALEGHSMWIIRSLPVSTGKVLRAKQLMHIILVMPLSLAATALFCAVTDADALTVVTNLAFVVFDVLFLSALGVTLGILKPNLDWTNETIPVKQGAPVVITLFSGMALPFVMMLATYLMRNVLNLAPFLWLLPAAGAVALNGWLGNKGIERFEEL